MIRPEHLPEDAPTTERHAAHDTPTTGLPTRRVTVTLTGCDASASRDLDVTDAQLVVLLRLAEDFGGNDLMRCEPGLTVRVHDPAAACPCPCHDSPDHCPPCTNDYADLCSGAP